VANLWNVALDDSCEGAGRDFLLAASLYGNKSAWNSFNRSWRACLRAEPRIEYFHQKELTGLRGQFRQFRDRARWPKPSGGQAANCKRTALEDVIKQSSLRAHTLAVSIREYRQVRKTAPNAKLFLDEDLWINQRLRTPGSIPRHVRPMQPQRRAAFA
jgi:hypothetical protein